MKLKISAVISALIFATTIISGCGGRHKSSTGSIEGFVYEPILSTSSKLKEMIVLRSSVPPSGYKVLAGALVKVSNTSVTAITDSNGHFKIIGLAPGEYSLCIVKDSYYSIEMKANVREGQTTNLEDYSAVFIDPIVPTGSYFPLTLGNQWNYSTIKKFTFFDLDGNKTGEEIGTGDIIKSIIRTEEISSVNTFLLKAQSILSWTTGTDENYSEYLWLAWNENQLFKYAYSSGDDAVDSDEVYNPARKLLSIPFSVGETWTLKKRLPKLPSRIIKYLLKSGKLKKSNSSIVTSMEVLAREVVAVPAGTFVCYKIKWRYEEGLDIEYFQWFAVMGLVKEEIIVNELIGNYTYHETTQLKSYILKESSP